MKQNLILKWLRSLGPGLIVAALVFGPSKMTITSKLGAVYGYSLLWIIAVAIFFMILFTSMAARIGRATEQSLLATITKKWGRTIGKLVGIGVFLVCVSFQAGNSVGVGIAIGELTHTPKTIWIILFTLIAITLLFFRSFYKVLEQLMIYLILLMLLCFVITLFFAKPDLGGVINGFVPAVPEGSHGLIIAFMASCFSIVGAFYNAYLVQERRRTGAASDLKGSGSVTGIIVLGLLSAIVLISAAAVLHPKGIVVNSATDMSLALQPVFGSYAAGLFLIGLFAAAFSSIVGTASIGGTLLGEALGFGNNFSSRGVRVLITVVMIVGSAIALIFGKLPLELIVLAQSVTIFIAPAIGIAMYLIANDEKIMGQNRNNLFFRVSGLLGLVIIIGLAVINIRQLFLS
ncbi:Nramp family divalent metal transporter [Niabella beijingensis]|uniref:Nramp family divalent metal transporter n=1 Tax=Niabella beijingensis TaxID=2872700 RepID=UPI001CBD6698|nr:Nramp family divalent metal transporter [Niabella beijingensis]MBZ4188605.1 Nramp family divalent metal transporter [Niabella beijingensis]